MLEPSHRDIVRSIVCLFVATTLGALAVSTAHATCTAVNPTIKCIAACPTYGEAWLIEWSDQSSCGCDEIEIYQDLGCSGTYETDPIAVLTDCSITRYVVCAEESEARFKIVYKASGSPTVDDIITACEDCDQ